MLAWAHCSHAVRTYALALQLVFHPFLFLLSLPVLRLLLHLQRRGNRREARVGDHGCRGGGRLRKWEGFTWGHRSGLGAVTEAGTSRGSEKLQRWETKEVASTWSQLAHHPPAHLPW